MDAPPPYVEDLSTLALRSEALELGIDGHLLAELRRLAQASPSACRTLEALIQKARRPIFVQQRTAIVHVRDRIIDARTGYDPRRIMPANPMNAYYHPPRSIAPATSQRYHLVHPYPMRQVRSAYAGVGAQATNPPLQDTREARNFGEAGGTHANVHSTTTEDEEVRTCSVRASRGSSPALSGTTACDTP
ncbi:hypothetical protein BDW22DRAFT_1432004 [Trametopsis cervina]|nr:hypothetical protein BDW22DRAFT_1432004 [Trametopsis cervina]